MLFVDPLDSSFRIQQDRPEIRSRTEFEARLNKVGWLLAKHLRGLFCDQPKQVRPTPCVGTVNDNDARAQALGCGLTKRKLAKIHRWNGPSPIIKHAGKAFRSPGNLLQFEQRDDLDD